MSLNFKEKYENLSESMLYFYFVFINKNRRVGFSILYKFPYQTSIRKLKKKKTRNEVSSSPIATASNIENPCKIVSACVIMQNYMN